MLASINPLGERARGTTFGRTFVCYLAGSLVAGAAVGAVVGLAGDALHDVVAPSRTAVATAVAAVCIVGLLLDLRAGGLRVPSTRRQVNENWLAVYRGWLYGAGFGFQLGLGVVTVVSTAAVYVMLALELLSGSLLGGLVIGAAFGLTRALPLLAVQRVHEPRQLRTLLQRAQRFEAVADVASRLSIAALAAAGLLAVAW